MEALAEFPPSLKGCTHMTGATSLRVGHRAHCTCAIFGPGVVLLREICACASSVRRCVFA